MFTYELFKNNGNLVFPFLDAKHNTGKIGLLIKTSDISMQVEVQTLHVRDFMANKFINKVL